MSVKKKKIVTTIVICVIIVTVIVSYLWHRKNKIECVIQSYSYDNISDITATPILQGFGLSDDIIDDVLENPQNYYLITFSVDLNNRHIYTLFNWEYTLNNTEESNIVYWVETNENDEDYKFEPFVSDKDEVRVLVKGEQETVKNLCETVVAEQSIACSGEIFPEDGLSSEGIHIGNHYIVFDKE